MKKHVHILMLVLLLVGQTILGPIGASKAFADSVPETPVEKTTGENTNQIDIDENKENKPSIEKPAEPSKPESKPEEEPKDPETPTAPNDEKKPESNGKPGDSEKPESGKGEQQGESDKNEEGKKPGDAVEDDKDSSDKPGKGEKPEGELNGTPEADGEEAVEDDEPEADEEDGVEDEEEEERELAEIPPAGQMDPNQVIKSTNFTVNGTTVTGTGPVTVKNNDKAKFKFNLELAAGHNYGPGSTLKYTLPEVFKDITFTNGTAFGELGTLSKSGREITITFNDNIIDELGGGTPFEPGAHFFIEATFDNGSNGVNQTINLPGQENIQLNFTPLTGVPVKKSNGTAKPTAQNSEYMEWEVEVNTDLKATNGPITFTDALTANNSSGHKFKKDSTAQLIELTMKSDGTYTEGTPSTIPTSAFTSDTVLTLSLDATKAYKIKYQTTPDDPGNNESVRYYNTAQYGTNSSGQKEVAVSYGTPLNKEVSQQPSGSNLATEWKIEYNFNKRSIAQKDAVITDSWATTGGSGTNRKQDMTDFAVYGADGTTLVDSNLYTKSDNSDGQGFTLRFNQDVTEPYVIKYKTTPADAFATADMTVTNTVERSDISLSKPASVTYTKKGFALNKSAGAIDYQNKTIKWSIVANQANYQLDAGAVFEDRFTTTNMTLQEGTLVVKADGETLTKGNDEDYTVNVLDGQEGFNVTLNAATNKRIEIEYTTTYDIKDAGQNTRAYTNAVTLTGSGLPANPTDSDTRSIKDEQKKNGKKDGKYNYATQRFEWEVELNFNYNTLTNAIFEDSLPTTQEIINSTIVVTPGTLNANGVFQPGTTIPISNTADSSNAIKLVLGEIDGPYKVTYESKDANDVYPETAGKVNITNTATLKDGTESNASWTKTVGVNYTDKLITKSGKQLDNGARIKWDFKFNYAQSDLSNVVITDTVGKDGSDPNQLIDEGSFKVYKVTFSGKSDNNTYTPSETKTEVTDFDVKVDMQAGTFTLKGLENGKHAYFIEYETTYLGASGSTVNNSVSVSYTSAEGTQASNSYSIQNFKYGNTGSTVKVPFVVVKTDEKTGEPMKDVQFTLYSDYQPGKALISKRTDANGVFDLGMKLTEGGYTLEETKVDGYEQHADIPFTLDRNQVEKSGVYKDKQIVNVENKPEGFNACTEFELTVYDIDHNKIDNKTITLTNEATGQVYTVNTDQDGVAKVYPTSDGGKLKVNAGKYTISTDDEGTLATGVSITFDGDCKYEVKPAPKCDFFTITLKDKEGNLRKNVTNITLKHQNDAGIEIENLSTDANGTIKLPSNVTKTGKYSVYEKAQFLGEIDVTYKTDCKAELTQAPKCETFTLTVLNMNGNPEEKDKEVTATNTDEPAKTYTGKIGDNGKVEFTNLEPGVYEVTVDGESYGTFSSNTDCAAEVQLKPTCETFTITVKENDQARPNVDVTVKDANGDVVHGGKTDAEGKIQVKTYDNDKKELLLPKGDYKVYDGDLLIGTITVDYSKDCSDELNAAPKCETFTLTVNDRSNNPRQNVDIVLKDAKGDTVATGTTDADGKVTFGKDKIGKGTYSVYEGTTFINNIEITDKCQDTVKPRPIIPPAPTCTEFTITVYEGEKGHHAGPGIEIVLKSGDVEIAKGTTNLQGDVVIPKDQLPNGSYDVYVNGEKMKDQAVVTDECEETITIPAKPVCTTFTLTVKENGEAIAEGKDVVLKTGDEEVAKGKTNAEGKVVFNKTIPHGEYDVFVDGKKVNTVTVDEGCEATVSFKPVCEKFTATVEKDGKPVKEKEIVLKDGDKEVAKGTTDEDGKVVFKGKVPEGDYDVYVDGEKSGKVTVEDPCETTIVLAPTCEDFTLTVYEDGKAVGPGKTLTLKQGDKEVTGTTNENGKIVFDKAQVPNGDYDVYYKGEKVGTVKVTGTCEDTVTLTPAPVCDKTTITVTEDGKPVESGKTVVLKDGDKEVARGTTDENGKVIIDEKVPTGSYDVEVDGEKAGKVTIDENCEVSVDIKKAPVCDKTTITVTEDGKPVESGKTVVLKDGDKEVARGTTDENGKVVIDEKVPTGSYDVEVDGEKAGKVTIDENCEVSVDIKKAPVCDKTIITVTEDGKPVESGKTVVLKDGDKEVARGTTDENGKVIIDENVPTGSYDVEVDGEKAGKVTIDENCEVSVDIKKAPVCDKTTITVTEDGKPVESGKTVVLKDGDKEVARGTTDENGKVIIDENVPAGSYDVEVDGEKAGKVTIDENCEVSVDIKKAPVCDKTTITVTEDGKPVESGKTVVLKDGDKEVARGTTDENGKVIIDENVPTGSYDVEVDGEKAGKVTIDENCEVSVDLKAAPVCTNFTLTVMQSDERVGAGIEITFKQGSNDAVKALTNADGQIVLSNAQLPHGTYIAYIGDVAVGTIIVDELCRDVIALHESLDPFNPEKPGDPGGNEPSDPNDPNNPGNPNEPGGNEPSDPNDPNNPGNPNEPGGNEPGDPNDPNNPGSPNEPGDGKPGDPNDPNNPGKPNEPGEGKPGDPNDPNKPGEKPGDPNDPNKPGKPNEPGDGKPGDPNDPNKPGDGKPGDPNDPNKPGDGKPGDPNDPNKPGEKPGDPNDPNKPGEKPGDPNDPNKPGEKPGDPNDPNKPDDPNDPNKPGEKPGDPNDPNKPGSKPGDSNDPNGSGKPGSGTGNGDNSSTGSGSGSGSGTGSGSGSNSGSWGSGSTNNSGSANNSGAGGSNLPQTGEAYPIIPIGAGLLIIAGGIWMLRRKKHV